MNNSPPNPSPNIPQRVKENADILAGLLQRVSQQKWKPTTEQWNNMFHIMALIQRGLDLLPTEEDS